MDGQAVSLTPEEGADPPKEKVEEVIPVLVNVECYIGYIKPLC